MSLNYFYHVSMYRNDEKTHAGQSMDKIKAYFFGKNVD